MLQRGQQVANVRTDDHRVGVCGMFQQGAVDVEEKRAVAGVEIGRWRRHAKTLHRAATLLGRNMATTLPPRGRPFSVVTRSVSLRLRNRAASSNMLPAQR